MLWFDEMRRPALKCERVGHDLRRQWRTGYVEPENRWRCVVDRVRQERDFCLRCQTPLTEWETTARMGVNSFTASPETHEAIAAGGSWMEGGFSAPKAPS